MFIANIANIVQTQRTTRATLKIAPTELNNEFTISFIATLWDMTLNGLSVLKRRRIFITGRSTFVSIMSNKEVKTIKPSN